MDAIPALRSGDLTAGTIASGLAGGTRHMRWYHQGTAYIQAGLPLPADAGPGGLRQWRGTRESRQQASVPERWPNRQHEPQSQVQG